MKRQLSKSLVDQAKTDLREKIIKRIIKDANDKGCWYLKSVDGSKIVDAVCHFRDKGTKKIFFKAPRLVFELIKGDLPEGFAVYQNCSNKYCVNPDHHYATTPSDYIKILKFEGVYKVRSGFKHKPETLARMSQAHKGKKPTQQARLRMSLAKIGVKRDPDLVAITAEKYFRGENNARAKLTEKQVLEIRSFKNVFSSHELEKLYPVTHSHIRSIWRKSCWKHL
jgi:hypothetical protein